MGLFRRQAGYLGRPSSSHPTKSLASSPRPLPPLSLTTFMARALMYFVTGIEINQLEGRDRDYQLSLQHCGFVRPRSLKAEISASLSPLLALGSWMALAELEWIVALGGVGG
ncbi:hypothetical protein HZH68_005289 [Vespula germanica]|uniref:Uncharacterized protein n=3 Tax=Vespula TaxID=7451 RepID=A0A834NEE3_VESGE|nr:hypothetical protein HZH66_004823 [Vespula vulgaris]KAF7405920.1 hypothetical protein HZH68_005289 [Vespula germanica]KAF7429392.1 hypothetical protein H0235_005790 [Vespula pensylvanica]